MTFHYTICFVLLMAEIAFFCVLISPMPVQLRKRLLRTMHESSIAAKTWYWLKVAHVFTFILFIDAVSKWWMLTENAEAPHEIHGLPSAKDITTIITLKFYAERNIYLTGIALLLSLILNKTYELLSEVVRSEDELLKLKGLDSGARANASDPVPEKEE
ncbi:uncharacterized protein VTP21DRAFT_938 [Calcarisporiella thermophila]|uniref:uncharacterized protein n=1 Tax=Calcarisporiella thermophila TaxID=911321 RepID=UPI003742DD1B